MVMQGKDLVGKKYAPFSVDVEKGRIAQFASAIGDTSQIYYDEGAAKSAGFHAIPAPITFPYTITLDAGQSFNVLEDMGVEKTKAVHGSQGFTYHTTIFTGDTITGQQEITDVYDKKDGALTFIETVTRLTNQNNKHTTDLHSVIVVRNT